MTRQRPRPTREHALDLLRQMLRIRRFEERCVELYSAKKIRGFLHLYIGEEAVAVGVHAGARPGRRGRGHLPRARPCAGPRRPGRRRSWPRCSASVEGCSRGRGGSMHLFDARTPLLRRQRHRRRRPAARRRPGAGRQDAGPRRVTACFFGEGAVAEGEFHESHEPRRAVAAAGAVLLREQPLRDGHRARALRVARPTSRCKAASYERRPRRSTAWTSLAVEAAAQRARRRRSAPAAGRTSSSAAPIASARTRCSTPSCTATRPRSRRGRSATRSTRFGVALREPGCSTTTICDARERGRRRDRRRGRVRRGRHAGSRSRS